MYKNRLIPLVILLTLVISALGLVPILAQSNDIVLTVHIEEWQQNFFNDDLFAPFEEAHPGVKVVTVIIPQDERYFATPSTVEEVPEFLEKSSNLAGQADLLQIQSYNSNRIMARAGAFLDITPLLNADADANLEDFYPAMLQSMQWDGGTWGLPIGGSEQILIYNQTRFDELGLSYPDESWTLNDFLSAGRELTTYNADGTVDVPGFYGFDSGTFWRAIYGQSLADPNAFPAQPLLTDPEFVEIIEQWAAFEAETRPEGFNFDFQEIPMTIQGTFILNPNNSFGSSDAVWAGSLLPGGTAGVQVQGFAISAGTQYPELSYELLQFMTKSPDMTFGFFGTTPARQSMFGVLPEDSPIFFGDTTPEIQELIELAIANALPASETDFFFYVYNATSKIQEGMDAESALLEVQEQAIEVLNAIDEQSANTIIAVATPVPTPVLAANEVSLTFGIEGVYSPLPNRELWEDAIDEFVAQDTQVGQIVLNTEFLALEERAETQDCFYLSSNMVPQADLSTLLSIDPFLAADPNFDPNDMVNGAILQMTREGSVWAIPFSLDPQVMWYDPTVFAAAGLPEPRNDWTVFEFIDTLQQLYAYEGDAVYNSQSFGGGYIYMLIAAFGGQLIDTSTPTYSLMLDDPNSIEAARQVLDLARDGYIDYQEIGGFGGSSFGPSDTAMFDAQLQPYGWRFQNRGEEFGDPHRVVMFPRGTQYTPVSYSLGGGYISANTPAPEACYRFLSYVSQRPELLFGMPARRSQFDAAVAMIDDSSDLADLYYAFDAALEEQNALVVVNPFTVGFSADPVAGFSNFLVNIWLNRAFDRYVLEDADLDTELAQAQQFSTEFRACADGVAPPERAFAEMSPEESQIYFEQFLDCAKGVDPSIGSLFGGGGGGGGGGGD